MSKKPLKLREYLCILLEGLAFSRPAVTNFQLVREPTEADSHLVNCLYVWYIRGVDMTNTERESINFKLPKTLTNALRTAARERNTTATDLVIQGLHHILGPVPGTVNSLETRLVELETQLTRVATPIKARVENGVENGVDDDLKQRLSLLEQQYEAITLRLAQIEGAISLLGQRSNTNHRRQSYQYHPPQLELQPYTGENLAKRLGVDVATLLRSRSQQSSQDFERWCRSKDPGSVGWRFGSDGLFHPIK